MLAGCLDDPAREALDPLRIGGKSRWQCIRVRIDAEAERRPQTRQPGAQPDER